MLLFIRFFILLTIQGGKMQSKFRQGRVFLCMHEGTTHCSFKK